VARGPDPHHGKPASGWQLSAPKTAIRGTAAEPVGSIQSRRSPPAIHWPAVSPKEDLNKGLERGPGTRDLFTGGSYRAKWRGLV